MALADVPLDLPGFMAELVARRPDAKVLVYTLADEPWLRAVRARLTVFSFEPMGSLAPCADYRVVVREDLDGLMAAFEAHCASTAVRYDMVYLNLDHVLAPLVRQINAALRCAAPGALFLFPGAVPPSRGMVGPFPTEAWFVGERWTLAESLALQGAEIGTMALAPTGLLLASGVTPVDFEAARGVSARMHADIATEEQFAAYFGSVPAAAMSAAVENALGLMQHPGEIRLTVDPSEAAATAVEQIDVPRVWHRAPPLFVIDLSTKGYDTSPLLVPERCEHGVSVDEFRDATLIGRDMILAGPSGEMVRAVCGKNKDINPFTGCLHTYSDEGESDTASRMVRREGGFYYPRSLALHPESLAQPVFLGTPDEQLNFGMWLLYSVPGVRLFQRYKHRYPRYFASITQPWVRTLLLGLGLSEDELLHQDPLKVYQAPQVATMRQSFRSLTFPPSDRAAFDEVAERGSRAGGPTPEKIFISRLAWTSAAAHRGLMNERALMEALAELGYVAVEPQTMTITGQAALFHNARSIVGLGGAGMFNVAFCKPGTRVIDIESTMLHIDAHTGLFASRGVEYGLILGDPDDSDPAPHHKRWTIDVPRVVEIVRQWG